MRLKIITHEKIIFDEEVDEIYTKGIDGEFGILKNHDVAQILTPTAEYSDDIDELRAKEALKRAQAELAEANAEADAKKAEAAIARAMARLKAKMNA